MSNYIIRKILTLIPMMLVISFLIYLGMELMPGDAVDFLIPPDALSTMSPEQLNAMRDALGLNDPFYCATSNGWQDFCGGTLAIAFKAACRC